MQRSTKFLFLFWIYFQTVSIETFSQAINALTIPDTLTGPVFNLSINQAQHQFLTGNITQTKSFNGLSFLGPTLIMRRGWSIQTTINNNLPDSTTLHWHGLHVSAHTDGGPHSTILPGQQWNPHFTCLDKASTYWYHPHFHGKTAEHTLQGAAGMIIVRDGEEAQINLPRRYGVDDVPLIVQSLEFNPNNQIDAKGVRDSILLVNGTIRPYVNVPAQWVRFRLLNASNARNFNFGLPANQTFKLIGSDGGLLGKPLDVTRIRLAPGERAEVLINFQNQIGQTISFKSFASEIPSGTYGGPVGALPPGTPSMKSPLNGVDFEVIEFRVVAPTFNPVSSVPDSLAAQTRLDESEATIFRTINFTAAIPGSVTGPFLLNDSSFNMNRIDFQVKINTTEIWTLKNQTVVAHPFHLHGYQFYILDRFGAPVGPEEAGRKDMVMVAPNEELRIINRFSDFADLNMPYMFHCHLLTHEDEGMMGQFLVLPLNSVSGNDLEKKFEVFPNPFSGEIRFKVDFETHSPIRIFDHYGRMVWNGYSSQSIDTKNWKSGIYVLKSKNFTEKIMKLN